MKQKVLYPDNVYEIGKDISTGVYLFFYCDKYKSTENYGYEHDEAVVRLCVDSPIHSVRRGHFGIVQVTNRYKYVAVENGIAVYHGDNMVNMIDLLQATYIADGDYTSTITNLYNTTMLEINLLRKDSGKYLYTGESDAFLWDQYWFSINSEVYWLGAMNVMTYKRYSSAMLCMHDSKSLQSFTFSENQFVLSRFYKGLDYFVCRLPKGFSVSSSNIEWIKPSFAKGVLNPTKKTIEEIHADAYRKLEDTINQLNEFEINLDIKNEVEFFLQAPDLMYECISFFETCFSKKKIFRRKKTDENLKFTFVVRATFDKQYYCAAKLADSAEKVEYDNKRNLFYVTFNGLQVEEIALMYSNLANIVNRDRKDLIAVYEFLRTHDFLTYLQDAADKFILNLRDQYGYSGKVTSSVLLSVIKGIKNVRKEKLNCFYSEMKLKKRVQSKWKSEYSLFVFIRRFVQDAIYQYHCDWLGQQSIDVYIPSQKIAVEYQGQQHYEIVPIFGGKESLEQNMYRDRMKRQLAEANGIKILYWNYSLEISKENVVNFLKANEIAYSCEMANNTNITSDVAMAPSTHLVKKVHTKRSVSNYVVQYDLNGNFVEKYISAREAAQKSGAGISSINKVLAGQRNSAGRFVWRRFDSDYIPEKISINFDVSKINDGIKK